MLTEAARRFADDRRLARAQAARLAILVEELVINAIEHGGVADDQRIDLTLADETGGLILTLSDLMIPGRMSAQTRSRNAAEERGSTSFCNGPRFSIIVGKRTGTNCASISARDEELRSAAHVTALLRWPFR